MTEPSKKPTVLHIITSANTGGAEMMALKLIETLKPSIDSCVIVLMGRGTLSPQLDALNVPVRYIDLEQGAMPGFAAVRRLIRFAREFCPDVIQGWMYHGNLAGCLARLVLSPRPALIWNVRQTLYGLGNEKGLTGRVIKVGAGLSKIPARIIYNSTLSAAQHEKIGYAQSTRLVIPNGFDLDAFKPDAEQRQKVRAELGVPSGVRLVGHVARFHPMKDHASMFRTARKVVDAMGGVRFVFAGWQMSPDNPEVAALLKGLNLDAHVILLGERRDVRRIMTAFDLAVSSSAWGEGFPNVVGEAMAAGVPCVVTDVGDSAHVVGAFGRVVPPADSGALADAVLDMLALEPEAYAHIAAESRKRMATLFSLDQVGAAYLDLYRKTAAH